MAKQWSMDEIDNLLESTQENGVSDLVAELMGDSAEAPQAEPVEEKTLPVPEEEDDFDDDYDYDYDDFDEDEDEGPDVEGVDDLFGDPVEEPAGEPEEEPAPEAPAEPAGSVVSPTPAPAASHVVNYATQAKAAQENLTDEHRGIIRKLMEEFPEEKTWQSDLLLAPAWIRKELTNLRKEKKV